MCFSALVSSDFQWAFSFSNGVDETGIGRPRSRERDGSNMRGTASFHPVQNTMASVVMIAPFESVMDLSLADTILARST